MCVCLCVPLSPFALAVFDGSPAFFIGSVGGNGALYDGTNIEHAKAWQGRLRKGPDPQHLIWTLSPHTKLVRGEKFCK